ncbi:cellulose biosynthesis cyclic di-GMP-binding regulatory protein BcsB [Cohnella silvisoli]|uniref:Cellulose biosynthesis cyclic di-GMP-binding regulatory protein BcsB n=1 Tax=Cohnella silvisoli TaxID=2873699 RepID=A0ABV1KYA2_9BACL|nr:cellulose biosynthesis cyclic di-GMP-binding regulatory protein BcsB [Cohnella silvisoli]MCD9024480.1 cellulose biosynthesis cyclic di-GMP-binding regulatory protein BcsB [Cohnella silvisoli]
MKRIASLWICMIILFVLTMPSVAFAEVIDKDASGFTKGEKESLTTFFDDRVFRGEGSKQDAFFEIGKGRQLLPGSSVDLYISHSPTLLPDHSTLTVLIDDIPIASTSLDKSNIKETLFRIDITSFDLKPGFHKVSFWAKMKVSAAVCEDPQNSSAWLVIHKKSKINLNYSQSYSTANFTWYPSPFIERGSPNPVHAILIVPDNVNQTEFKAAARMSQFLTAQSPNNRLNVPIYAESDLTEAILRDNSNIWIGQADRWKANGQTVLRTFSQTARDDLIAKGIIAEVVSPWNDNHSSLVVVGSGKQLMNAAEILTTESLYKQLQSTYSIIPETIAKIDNQTEAKTDKTYNMTLEQLGYGNLVTEGVLQGGSTFNYSIPNNWDLTNGANLHLVYKHSRSISFGKSVMTVKLNGVPVQSVKLEEKTSVHGEVDVKLDSTVIGTSRNLFVELSFQFVNPTGGTVEEVTSNACSADTLLGDWAFVDKSSYFTFTPEKRTSYNLDSLPFPFVSGEQWDKTTFLMKNRKKEELNAVMTLIGRMGTDISEQSDIRLEDYPAGNLQDALKDRNVIFVGPSAELPPFLNGYEDSYVKFTSGQAISQSDKVEILTELAHRAAVIQLTRSPLNPDRSVLILAGIERTNLSFISRALADAEKSSAINGRIVVIDDRNQIHSFPRTIDSKKPVLPNIQPASGFNRPLRNSGNVFLGTFVIVLSLIVVLFIMVRRKNNG